MDRFEEKLKEVFEFTVEDDIRYDGPLEIIDYYALFCKSAARDQLHRVKNNNLCMYNFYYENSDAVLMIFAIPINTEEESGGKYVAERIMDVIKRAEDCFVVLDYVNANEVEEDKFVYVTIVKKIEKEDDE